MIFGFIFNILALKEQKGATLLHSRSHYGSPDFGCLFHTLCVLAILKEAVRAEVEASVVFPS